MFKLVDKLKINAQKSFEENVAKSSMENFKQGKNIKKYLKLFKFYKIVQFLPNRSLLY